MQEENPKMQPKIQVKPDDEEDSEWSLESLEDLKGLSLNELREQEDNDAPITNKEEHAANKKNHTVSYPPLQQLTQSSQLHEVGQVIAHVGELYIVEVKNIENIVDLDNWLFDAKKQLIGFVIDVFGKVDQPFYAVKLKQGINELPEIMNQKVYFADGCKTLTQDDIKSIRAKSSIDLQGGQDLSDDDEDKDDQNNMYSQPNLPQQHHQRKRRRSFEQQPINQRERTRQKRNKNNQQKQYGQNRINFNNQAYLENMYSTYYHQMMQLYQQGQQIPPPIPPSQFSHPPQSHQNINLPQPPFMGQSQPPFMGQNQPGFGSQNQPGFGSQNQPGFGSQNQLPQWPQPPKDFNPHQGNKPFPPK